MEEAGPEAEVTLGWKVNSIASHMKGEFPNEATASLGARTVISDVLGTTIQIAAELNHSNPAFQCSCTLCWKTSEWLLILNQELASIYL